MKQETILNLIELTLDLPLPSKLIAHRILMMADDLPLATRAGLYRTLSESVAMQPATRTDEAVCVLVTLRGQQSPAAIEFRRQAWQALAAFETLDAAMAALAWWESIVGAEGQTLH